MICDLAETYHVFNYRELPPSMVATLVLGLRENSRVKMKLTKTKITLEQSLLSLILDGINYICWTYSKDAHKGKPYNKKSVYKTLKGEYEKEKEDLEVFSNIEDFETYMNQFIR